MRRSVLLACLIVSLACFAACQQFKTSSATDSSTTDSVIKTALTDSVVKEEDIRQQVLALNNKEALPVQNFRKGHVVPTTLKNYLEKTEYGYVIKLPSPTIIPTPAVVNGNLYMSGGFGSKQYYSFNSLTGNLNWAVDLDDDGPSAPAIQDGAIVFNTESCTIFACDMVSGKQIWSYYLGDPLMSMPTVAGGIVFTAYPASYLKPLQPDSADGKPFIFPTHVLIAIELKTGKILWQRWIDSDIMSAPVAKDDLLYITTFSGALYKVKQKSGEMMEAKAMRATSAPIFSGSNGLIVSQRSDREKDSVVKESIVYSYGTAKRKVIEKRADYLDKKVQGTAQFKTNAAKMDAGNGFASGAPTTSNYMAAEVNIGYSNVSSLQAFQGSRGLFRDGSLYSTMGDEIICTDSTGKVAWKRKLDGDLVNQGGFMGTPPVYAGNYIIVATLSGDVLLMNQKDGTLFKKYNIKDQVRYQPVVDNGWIYVTTANGRMHAINTGDAKITGWNMWGGNAARTNTSIN